MYGLFLINAHEQASYFAHAYIPAQLCNVNQPMSMVYSNNIQQDWYKRDNVKTQQPQQTNIIFDIFGVLFHWDPLQHLQTGQQQFIPIAQNIDALFNCASLATKEGLPLHRLFILSNCKLTLLEQLYVAYPEVFEPFESIVIPTHAGYAKPDKRMFEYLLDLHALNPRSCIFIDDAPENTKAAIALGITGITYGPGVQLQEAFIEHGVIPYTHAV